MGPLNARLFTRRPDTAVISAELLPASLPPAKQAYLGTDMMTP